MKWIGQHIYDLVSRFRSDVYLESISSGTIASGGYLGLDSNNKIVKSISEGDITSISLSAGTGVDLTSISGAMGGAYEATIGVDVSDFLTNGSDNRVVTASGTDRMYAEEYFTYDGTDLFIESDEASKPVITIKNTSNGTTGGELSFVKDKGAAGADDDEIGTLTFWSDNSAQEQTQFANIKVSVSEADDTDEAGKMSFGIATSNGSASSLTSGLVLEGEHNTREIDATIGYGTSSTTTVAGTLTMGSTAALNNTGEIQVATQPNIDSIGTDGDTLDILGDTLSMVNTTASKPALNLTNQADDASGPIITLKNQRFDSSTQAGEDNDYLGSIYFQGYDDQGTPASQIYAIIRGHIHDATSGEESGKLTFGVATHDGGVGDGLVLTGGSVDNEIDVAIGAGSNSVVTIPGHIDLAGDIDVDGTLETDALTIGGTALTSVCSPVAGHSSIATVGTIGTGTWQGSVIASAYLDAATAHLSTQKHMTHHSFTADIDTTKTYIGMLDADSESTGTTGIDMPLVFPTASKLLQVTLRSNKNLSALTYTWRLETQATGVGFGTGPTIVGTQSGSGPAQTGHTVYDFTSSLDSGDNVIDAFDAVYLSLQSSGATANTKYYITCVWEVNMSSY